MPTTVDKIRRALEKRDGIAEGEMRPLAEAYKVEVQAVNQRLDEAVMLLRKGLRSEAIQRIEMTPNTLDLAAELEFPEWDEWNEILQFLGIPLPPKLNVDYVAQVNEAIIESLPLEALLRRHRRLAIAKAPLSIRLRTLRQIAHVDSGNPVWGDDVETWEKIRLGQIETELQQSLEREDSRQLFLINEELTSNQWRVKPSPRLIEQSQFAAEAHVRENMDRELGQFVPALERAFADRDESSARSLRSQWQASRAHYKIEVSPKLQSRVSPTLRWLEDLDRQAVMESERQIAISRLEECLDGTHSADEIQAAQEQATKFGEPLPQEVAERIDELAAEPAKQAKRKWMAIGIAAGAVFITGSIAAFMVYSASRRAQQREDYLRQMETFVSEERNDEALAFFGTIQSSAPDVAALPRMVAMQSQAVKAVEKDQQRSDRFEELLRQANSDNPELIDGALIPQLEELATSEGERARIDDLRQRKDAYNQKVMTKQSDDMIAQVGEYWTTFGELQSRGNSATNLTALEQLRTLVVRLSALYPRRSDVATNKQEQLRSAISSTIDQMKRKMQSDAQRSEAIDMLVNAGSLEVYGKRLRELSRRSIANTGFIDFARVIDEQDYWLDVDRTNDWLKRFAERLNNGVTSGEATELMESAQLLGEDVSPNPVFDAMPNFTESMQEIRRRNQILDDTFNSISNHPLSQLVTLTVDGQQYLLTKTFVEDNTARMKNAGNQGVMVVVSPTGAVRNRGFDGPLTDLKNEPMETFAWLRREQASRKIDFASLWEQTYIRLVSELMTKRPELDARIKEWLIFQLLSGATRGSDRLAKAIPQSMATLQRRTSTFERWYEPHAFSSELPEDVDTIIKSELRTVYPRFADPLSDMTKIATSKLEWIGFLTRNDNNQIEYHLRSRLPENDGALYVAIPSREGDAETSLVKIGTLTQGHIQLTSNPVDLIAGRPLFLFPN
ncbi:hypothetical protein [Rhodopirellula sp. MGV]|uniref:hypothetical protein n=1 Tax=Rhodopirellula sp. MGV TaxID=2023130 RepID=UPI000B96EA6E|nr:hypothetical protein [Rhodopirellula sp. MGV]OYP34392.1 hypothetical protein CGZ80_15155 [Rhodopirellula sp. MGV]PNY37434.1 hypothetical protein C2E31_07870 [Rhodopirellula baltica]